MPSETDEFVSKPFKMKLMEFLSGADSVLSFPSTLTSNERRLIHEVLHDTTVLHLTPIIDTCTCTVYKNCKCTITLYSVMCTCIHLTVRFVRRWGYFM